MKRLHVHLSVADLPASVRFYAALFGAPPTVAHSDYAKWMLDDPRVNFAISSCGAAPGLDHLGIQVETPDELADAYGRLRAADGPVLEEGRPPAAMHGRKRPGSPIRRAWRGRRS
ncbi:VOC family protein [Acidisphaera rubrifaciens]|uniref:Glyoxalase/bleomycin resistance protein/dioxygenase n=1 Tax=Acidisphaera rubrifaciens HS-AP3 TaxID=1231350 RepID=A0A0D6P9V8_9PROT|nr:VOC family protein [Acidisphaera rubrifaciens]GAN77639.1 glyoxalase/bleomycin resistance protein/dioxygenase [Acidisphaera rubrifaciens HS-AP3]